jgi:hypothetical protein
MRSAIIAAGLCLTLFAQEHEIDRIAVVVNRQPITMGEWSSRSALKP